MNTVELEVLRQMIREEMEEVLRRVVREELAALIAAGSPSPPVSLPAEPGEELLADLNHPYSLSDRELTALEQRMTPEEMNILRKRCYAWRATQGGHHKSAATLRTQADNLEKRMVAKRSSPR